MRLATWNLHGSAEPNTIAIADLIRSFQLDVLAVQELRRHQSRTMTQLLAWSSPYWCFKHNGWYGLPRRAEGIAFLTAQPATDRSRITLSVGAPWWNYTRRVAQQAVIDGVRIVNAHLASHNDGVARAAQVERLITFADRAQVLAGDFNDVPDGPVLARLAEAGWHDAFNRTDNVTGGTTTSPVEAPVRRIDHVLVRDSVTVSRVHIPSPGPHLIAASDHLPVIVDVTVPR